MDKKEIQNWIDNRFGVPNTFNIQLLIDFLDWYLKSNQFGEDASEHCREMGWREPS